MHKATDKYRSTFCHLLTQKWLKAYAQTTTINDLRCHTNTTELKKKQEYGPVPELGDIIDLDD